jgi:hypothetical protein
MVNYIYHNSFGLTWGEDQNLPYSCVDAKILALQDKYENELVLLPHSLSHPKSIKIGTHDVHTVT